MTAEMMDIVFIKTDHGLITSRVIERIIKTNLEKNHMEVSYYEGVVLTSSEKGIKPLSVIRFTPNMIIDILKKETTNAF